MLIAVETSEKPKIKIKLLAASKDLFWKHGIKRVTVEGICVHAGISKPSFYRNFKNKQDLVKTLIVELHTQGQRDYDKIMNNDDDFRIKVARLIKHKHQKIQGIGKEFIKDVLTNDQSEVSKLFQKLSTESLQTVRNDFTLAQKKGEIRKDMNINFMMYMLEDFNKKLLDEKLRVHYNAEEDLIMEVTNFFFYGILP